MLLFSNSGDKLIYSKIQIYDTRKENVKSTIIFLENFNLNVQIKIYSFKSTKLNSQLLQGNKLNPAVKIR